MLVSLPVLYRMLSLTGARASSRAYKLGALLGDQSRGSGISGPARGAARRSCFEPHSVLNLLNERKLICGVSCCEFSAVRELRAPRDSSLSTGEAGLALRLALLTEGLAVVCCSG